MLLAEVLVHNISPHLLKQQAETRDKHCSHVRSLCRGAISPTDQQLPRRLSRPNAQHLCRLGHHSAAHNGWQPTRDFSWSGAFKSPQEFNVKDIVNLGASLDGPAASCRHSGTVVQAQPRPIPQRELECPMLLVTKPREAFCQQQVICTVNTSNMCQKDLCTLVVES
jgi:hypothetical protein